MEKRGKVTISGAILALLMIITIIHLTAHFMLYGTGIKGFGEAGVSGLSIGPIDIEGNAIQDFNINNIGSSTISKYIIAGEWITFILVLLYVLIKGKIKLDKEIKTENVSQTRKVRAHSGTETDIDLLYELIKEKKELRLEFIAKTFGVTEGVALEWCKILEEGDLAILKYPTVGSPKLTIAEEKDEKEKVEEK
ncbi:hypothetical protein AUJ84_01705 [Candidatus Pacearchaeota archaeon CG1_02_32_132]|nr:MAG: hypothetical protein AUJ84_01705 [Candidatus Pacearchaeota archaeon CG1_02_32_132]